MTHILTTTTQVLDLLIPHEPPDRNRILSAVQAVLDLTHEHVSEMVTPIIDEPLEPIPTAPAKAGRKPPKAAPKELKGKKSAKRLEWASKIPALLSDGPKSPHQLRELLKINKSPSTFSESLKDCLEAGKVTVCGTTRGRLYSLTSQ